MVLADALLMRGGLAAVHLILGDDSDTTNPDLLLLHKQLATGAESRIAPHLTLYRGGRGGTGPPPPPLLSPSFDLSFTSFALMASVRGRRGVRYDPLEIFPLN